MAEGYQIRDQEGIYFLTFQIVNWVDIFTRKECRDVIIESMIYCQRHKQLIIYAYVIMSNHVHVIISSESAKLSDTDRDFKTHTSKKLIKTIYEISESRRDWMLDIFKFRARKHKRNQMYQVWTHDNHPVELTNNIMMEQRLDYIHNNPVKAAIVSEPEYYLYSSAIDYTGEIGLIDITHLE